MPDSVGMPAGGTQQFAAVVTGGRNEVTWSADAGSIDGTGLFTAPVRAGTAHITATSSTDPRQSGTATVTVLDRTRISVMLEPQSPIVELGSSQQFTARVGGTSDGRVVWSVAEGGSGGSITEAGLYTPAAAGVWHVVATSAADGSASATTAVTVQRAAIGVHIDPQQITARPDQVVGFRATVTGTADTAVRWSIDCCGTVMQDGTVTAPHADGTYHVTAQSHADGSRTATAALIVATPTGISVSINPAQAMVVPRTHQDFTATVSGSSNQEVTWSIEEKDGGTIDPLGRYFPPFPGGTGVFHVVATSKADPSKSARATVTVAYEDLLDGGGPVAPTVRLFALWWGPAADFPADTESSLTALLSVVDGSGYLAIANEYFRGAKATASFAGSLHDPSVPPTNADVESGVCRALQAAAVTPRSGDLVLVFASKFPQTAPEISPSCASHGWVTCGGMRVMTAYLPNPAGSKCIWPDFGCSSRSDATRSLALATGHELIEAMTDPFGTGWKDENGAEIADKCISQQSCIAMPGGLSFQLQSLYSNATHACVP